MVRKMQAAVCEWVAATTATGSSNGNAAAAGSVTERRIFLGQDGPRITSAMDNSDDDDDASSEVEIRVRVSWMAPKSRQQRPCGNLTGVWHVVGVIDPGDDADDSEPGGATLPYEEFIFLHQDSAGISGHEAAERSVHGDPFDVTDAYIMDGSELRFTQVFLGPGGGDGGDGGVGGQSCFWVATVEGSAQQGQAVSMHGRVSGAIES